MNPTKLLIRADAGPVVGTGHVMRMLALGQAWKKRGGSVAFAVGAIPNGLLARIQTESFDVYRLENSKSDAADARETLELALQIQPGWIGLDGYEFNDRYQSALRESSAKLLVLDDFNHSTHSNAHLIVNQNIYANPTAYRNSSAFLLTGPRYSLLRSEFRAALTPAKPTAKEARRILITFGGADSTNWTLRTLRVLSKLDRKKLVVDCVVGACFSHTREVEEFKKTANLNLRLHRNVDRMSALMARADLAISAGGSTCYELARCGIPTLVVSIADNQVPVAQAFNEHGAMISVDEHEPVDDTVERRTERLEKTLKRLIRNYELRKNMSETGMRLVDGNGGARVCQAMSKMQFSFRAAQTEDAKQLWHWRNDPEVRSVSFNQEAIELESHRKWLGKRINDPNTKILICESEDRKPLGQVRFDISDNGKEATISIIVDQAMRGRGLGKTMIDQTCSLLFQTSSVESVLAQIKTGNTASERAFRAAGFSPIEPAIIGGKIALQYQIRRPLDEEGLRRTEKRSA